VGRIHRRSGRLGSLALLAIAAALILRPWEGGAVEGGPRSARAYVVRAIDGDTIEARIDGALEDVRYIGVDTPETVKPGTPVQCFGPRASAFNHRLVEGRRVRLVFGVERRDVYGRLLAYVYLDRRLVNATLVRRGLARSLTIPPNDRLAPLFRRLELRAARSGRGLWGACPT
jgi:micrococcal nuclease